ncbi:hypothetical protein SAY87_027565 [Trapa incisa]|uniref:Leucine-rich repeat-containing N-terminal plant-type domain-containing protein n=1 Tax=Trapa incisa TaxID=236973 RepID=A0AAN7JMM0_9MYRT|nr:hypothetical protein SAY87_027565 [Trapa incisa]
MHLLALILLLACALSSAASGATAASPASCIEAEKEALLLLRRGLTDYSSRLSSWSGDDCCSWKGVTCSKVTGNVERLDLRSPCVKSEIHYEWMIDPVLGYGNCTLTGWLSPSLAQLRHLRSPQNISNLCELYSLRLSFNYLMGDISSLLANPSGCFKAKLRFLDLGWNKFSGHLSDEIGSFKSLEYIDLASNSIGGPIPESLFQLSSLKYLNLMQNKLTGSIPTGLGQLSNLLVLELINNSLTGLVTEQHFANLTSLILMGISLNELVFNTSPAWIPPFQLKYLGMSGSDAGPKFPVWLRSQRKISLMDISNCSISDVIPDWFYNNFPNLEGLDLSDNQLVGQIHESFGDMMPTLRDMNFARNHLDGRIPTSMCNMIHLFALNLLNNNLSGPIPNCWRSLRGHIPSWIGVLSRLSVLNLDSNSFNGEIPKEICQLDNIRVLSLARNNLSGNIPLCFDNLTMLVNPTILTDRLTTILGFYGFGIDVNTKSSTQFYATQLRYLFSIDLSNNMLGEYIGEGLTKLSRLRNLNLSYNCLVGHIPPDVSNMGDLESLDLSVNQLSGSIPQSLSQLSFLSYLNLSFNHLSGRIPVGPQLNTFKGDSYSGNDGLCGPPLSKNCTGDGEQPNIHKQYGNDDSDGGDDKLYTLWVYAGIIPGFVIGLLGVCGSFYFKRSWRQRLFLW